MWRVTMKKVLLSIVLCFSLISIGFGQQFGSSTAPEQVPSNTNVEVKVETDAKFVSIKARKSLFEVVKVYEGDNGSRNKVLNASDLTTLQSNIKGQPRLYTFTGPDGKYLVEITQFDPVMGIKEEAITVIIGTIDPALVSLMCDKESVIEGQGQVTVTARLNKPVDKEVTVTPNFGGTATLFEDYDFQPKACCISIPAGQLTGTAVIIPIAEEQTISQRVFADKAEGDETVQLTIDKVTNAKIGNPSSCNFIIKDSDPDDPDDPDVDDLETQIEELLAKVSASTRNEMVDVRMPDGNTMSKKAVHAIGQEYGDIAREVKKSPNSWDIATMVDESKTRVGGVIPSSSLPNWLGFFSDLTKLQKGLDTSNIDDWIEFFEAVDKVLGEA